MGSTVEGSGCWGSLGTLGVIRETSRRLTGCKGIPSHSRVWGEKYSSRCHRAVGVAAYAHRLPGQVTSARQDEMNGAVWWPCPVQLPALLFTSENWVSPLSVPHWNRNPQKDLHTPGTGAPVWGLVLHPFCPLAPPGALVVRGASHRSHQMAAEPSA